MTQIPIFPLLLKATTDEGVQEWQISVEAKGNVGEIVIKFGRRDGKQQVLREPITKGKNLGKKNETTPLQQAIAEAQSKWEKQRTRKCYGLTVEESAAARAAAPMLAESYKDFAKVVAWDTAYVQPKLDGFRCLARCLDDGTITMTSREGKPINTMPHIAEQLKFALKPGDSLDGELYVQGPEFENLSSYIKRVQDGTEQVQYHVYDAPIEAPFIDRYQYAQSKLRRLPSGIIVPVETKLITAPDQLEAFQLGCLEQGFEGAMLRHGVGAYDAGTRSQALLKVKTFQDAEFKIVGVKEGRGTHAGMAIFVCDTGNGHTFDALAHGTHAQKREAWVQGEANVGRMLTVQYFGWTSSTPPSLRFPTAKRFAQKV